MPKVHVYPLSRLVHAPAPNWEKLLNSIEEGKTRAFRYYQPMREAVIQYCVKSGKGKDGIVANMLANARQFGGKRASAVAADNHAAFTTFVSVFYPQIKAFRRHFLRDSQNGCDFNGVTLVGAPHFEAVDSKGRNRYAVLLPSGWPEDDLKAYLELMAIVIKQCFGADATSLWPLDLKNGTEIKWRSGPRMRQRCAYAAQLYGRLITLLENEAL